MPFLSSAEYLSAEVVPAHELVKVVGLFLSPHKIQLHVAAAVAAVVLMTLHVQLPLPLL